MNFYTSCIKEKLHYRVDNFLPRLGLQVVVDEIVEGFQAHPKHISSKYFYDAKGSKLFEAITHLPEYYPTRTEKPLIKKAAQRFQSVIEQTDIIEIGSGDCSKISILLESIAFHEKSTIRYIPIDVSEAAIEESVASLAKRFTSLMIHGIVADFMTQLHLIPRKQKRIYCFFGSTIGNCTRKEALSFFRCISESMQPGDRLLLGMDRIKSRDILELAYNDDQQVTAKFNKNCLKVVNKLIQSDFNTDQFDHVAFYDTKEERIEMHLKAKADMIICSPYFNEPLIIKKHEMIHTENSHKFSDRHVREFIAISGLEKEYELQDENHWFSLIQFIKPGGQYYADN